MVATRNGSELMPELASVSNDAERLIDPPYRCEVTIQGTAAFLFHRWSIEGVEEKSKAAKGSKTKKTDDLETYVYRTEGGNLGIPGENLRQSCIAAAKYRQDPRSPRKSMMDLVKAILVCETDVADFGQAKWDMVDQRRVVIQRAAVTRSRPALHKGWTATFIFLVLMPQYLPQEDLLSLVVDAGRLSGLGDFRPSYGRFQVVRFDPLSG